MKKYVILISISIILTAVLFCGCNGENDDNKTLEKTFIGKWKLDGFEDFNETWNFLENGRVTKTTNRDGNITTEFFDWEDTDNELCIIPLNRPEDQRCGIYEFKDNNKSFTWTVMDIEINFTRITE